VVVGVGKVDNKSSVSRNNTNMLVSFQEREEKGMKK
jgi:hypothetical protein